MIDIDENRKTLFKGICFYLNDSITPNIRIELTKVLLEGGAQQCPAPISASTSSSLSPIRRFDETLLTHFITDSLDFPEHSLLREINGQEGGGINVVNAVEQEPKIAIVTPYWVTRSYDIGQLRRFFSANKADIFSGLCFCTSELPPLDIRTIQLGVMSMGGEWREELTKEVTHLVVVAPHGKKYDMAMKFGAKLGIIILLPEWFYECLAIQQLVPVDLFTFPDPHLYQLRNRDGPTSFEEQLASWTKGKTLEDPPTYALANTLTATILHYGSNQARRATDIYQKTATQQCMKPEVEPIIGGGTGLSLGNRLGVPLLTLPSASSLSNASEKALWPVSLPIPTGPMDPIFSERLVYLASDLALKPGLEQAIKSRIELGGGKCWSWGVDGKDLGGKGGQWERRRIAEMEMKAANTVVTNRREGWEYWHAYSQGKTIGNLAWIYHILSRSKLDSPLDRLIHYPLPPGEIEQFKNLTITITNYTGAAREYVRALIVSVGAKFEGAMSRHTHYVITADDSGSKVKHAKQWHIPIVNHLWLEACLLHWKLVQPTDPRYHTTTSNLVNYTSILGNTSLPIKAIEIWAEQEDVVKARLAAMEEIMGEDRSGEKFEDLSEQDLELENDHDHDHDREREHDQDDFPGGGEDLVMLDAEREEGTGTKDQVEEEQEEKEVDQLMEEAQDELAEREEEEEEAVVVSPVKQKKLVEKKVVEKMKNKSGKKKSEEEIGIIEIEDHTSISEVEVVSKSKSKKNIPISPPHHSTTSRPILVPSPAIETPKEKARLPKSKRKPSHSRSSSPNPPTSSARKEIHCNIGTSNILPSGLGRRGAALTAAANLAIQMPDANRFAAELNSGKKRGRKESGGGGGSARKNARDKEVDEEQERDEEEAPRKKGKNKAVASKSKKEVSDEEEEGESSDGVDNVTKKGGTTKKSVVGRSGAVATGGTEDGVISSFDNPPRAKPAKAKESITNVRVLCTGLALEENSAEMKKFFKLGAKWTNHPSEVTHLVVKGILRTEKFLTCLVHHPIIATKEWITASIKAGKILDATKYQVKDLQKEKEIGVTLETIQSRIKTQGKIFQGLTLYLTPKLSPEVKVLQKIIVAHGGTASLAPLSSPLVRTQILSHPTKHLIISCEADRKLWESLANSLNSNGEKKVAVFSVAPILDGAMIQDRGVWEGGDRRIDWNGRS